MRYLSFLVLIFALVACNAQGSSGDVQSAQSLLPNISGYTVSQSKDLISAITATGAGGSLTTGNVPLAAAFARADTVLKCLEDSGTAGANVYTETNPANLIPQAGAVFIINQTRLNQNLLNCLLTTGQQGSRIQSQSVEIRPCAEGGNFTFQSNEYAYIYVGVGDSLCGFFAQHFNNLKSQ